MERFYIKTKMDKFLYGAKKGFPIVFGYIPMGIGYAAIAIKAGLNPFETVGMSVFVYAGAGQIMAVSMLAQGATIINIVLTSFVVNFRYFIMNTVVFNKVTESNTKLNILSSHFVVDECFALFSLMEESSIWTYLGVSVIPYLSWVLGAAIGVFVLNLLPVIVTNSFNISLYALFVAILIPNLKRSKTITLTVIITAILNFILQYFISNWSLIVATIIGAIIGTYIVDDKDLNIEVEKEILNKDSGGEDIYE